MTRLFQSIGNLKGVGQKRCQIYAKLGIVSPYDLLYYLPRDYRDYREPVPVSETEDGAPAVVRVTITAKKRPIYARGGIQIYGLESVDEDGTPLSIRFFNTPYTYQTMLPGQTYTMYGKITVKPTGREIHSPTLLKNLDVPIEAIYPQTTGLTSAMIRTNMQECLDLMDEQPFETLPPALRSHYGLMPLPKAMHCIHQPENLEDVEDARRRLAFEEMLRLQLGLHLLAEKAQRKTDYPMDRNTDLTPFFESLPFTLTDAQQRAVIEIVEDLCSGAPMNRLLQGDVGSGKTAVAAAACYFTAQNGMQSVLMAPTEILAGQHYQTLRSFLEPLGITVVLLTGSVKGKEKKSIYSEIANGTAQVIVGTHAVFQKAVEYAKLGLVITDEQHRFGVGQRAALAEKGGVPHKLVMSATPIPRTLALLMYGDLQVSILDSKPLGRLPIKTYAVSGAKMRPRVIAFMKTELDKGASGVYCLPGDRGGRQRAESGYRLRAADARGAACRLAGGHSPRADDAAGKGRSDGEIPRPRDGCADLHDGRRGRRGCPERDGHAHRGRGTVRLVAAAPAPGARGAVGLSEPLHPADGAPHGGRAGAPAPDEQHKRRL